MTPIVDADVQSVLEFMQSEVPASKLIAVAEGVALMAPILWGHYQRDAVRPMELQPVKITMGLS